MATPEPPSQSGNSNENAKNIQKVVTSNVVKKKQTMGSRFMSTFVGGDSKSAWEYVVTEVLMPSVRDMLADAISQGAERMIFGETRSRSRRGSGSGPGYVSYGSYSSSSTRRNGPQRARRRAETISPRARANHNFDEIIIERRDEADNVLERMYDILEEYGAVTVADFYTLVGVTGEYTDNKWGWTSLTGAGLTRARQGYLLDLPRPEPLTR